MDIQAIGVCRFSLLVTGGFQDGPRDLQARAAYLFQPRRLATRMAWFEHVLAPSIRGQEDDRFRFVVLASDQIPEPWAGRLRDIAASVPRMEVEFAPPGPHYRITNGAIRSRLDRFADVIAQFRLDDDDALGRDYVSRIHSDLLDGFRPLFERFGAVSADYIRGLILEADGHNARLRRSFVRTWSCGQTMYLRPDAKRALFDYGHHRHHRDMPVVQMQDRLMFLRGRHTANDTPMNLPAEDTEDWTMDALQRQFGISLEQLQQALREAEALPEG